MLEILKANWYVIIVAIIAFAEVIVRLTPTSKDDSIVNWIKRVIDVLVPNKTKRGDKHE